MEIPVRDIEYELRQAAFALGSIFSDPTRSNIHPPTIRMLSLEEIIEQTQQAEFEEHHQTYQIDGYLADITEYVINKMLDRLKSREILAGIRIEHDIEQKSDARKNEIKKKVTISNGDNEYIVHANPVEGSDNFSAALNSWANLQLSNISGRFNSDSCVTLAFAERKNPFNPIATAVYSFRNHYVYSAFRGVEGTYVGTMGVQGVRTPTLMDNRVSGQFIRQKDIRFFIADYKYDIVEVPAVLEEALRMHGETIGIQVDRIRGSVASAANILKVVIENEALGYFDYRPAQPLIKSGIKGKYASLKATNVLHVLPIARSRGYIDRTIRGEDLDEAHTFDLADPNISPDISLLLVPAEMFDGRHSYKVMVALNSVPEKIDQKVRSYIEDKKGTGYKIPGHNLTNLLSGEGAYKSVWLANVEDMPGKQVVVKIFDSSKTRGTTNLARAGLTQKDMENNEKNMEEVREESTHVAFMYGLKHDGIAPDGSTVSYMIEKPFKETTAKKYGLGQVTPLDDIVRLSSHLIDAVAAGHSLKEPIIHGDIKDENFGVDYDGDGLLTDYGTSFLMNGKDKRKENIGSIHTMAPELYEEGTVLTTQSDVFSISCVIAKWCTGYHPFSPHDAKPSGTGETRQAYEASTKKEKERSDYSHIYSHIQLPQELRDIVIKGMQKDPNRRYKDAVEMNEDMKKVVENHQTYKRIMHFVESEASKSAAETYLDPHLIFTEKWLLLLNPNASYASRIAAQVHDIGRLGDKSVQYKGEPGDITAYLAYKQEHAKECAEAAKAKLIEFGATAALTEKIEYIVAHHDVPRVDASFQYSEEVQGVVDADSLSFFQFNAPTYIKQHEEKPERIKMKVKFMYNRMSERAKHLLHKQAFFEVAMPYITGS